MEANTAGREADLEARRIENVANQATRQAEIEAARREQERNALNNYGPYIGAGDVDNPFYDPFGGIENGVADTASNTARMANALDRSEDHLRYLRTIAERQAVSNVTVEVSIDMSNMNNNVNSEGGIDGMLRELEERLAEAVESSVEGVYA